MKESSLSTTIYLLRQKSSGLYYKKRANQRCCWVALEEAAIWPKKAGPNSAKGIARRLGTPLDDMEVVPFSMIEKTDKVITVTPKRGITIVRAEDWEGVYIDGKLIDDAHSFEGDEVLFMLGIDCEVKWADDTWLSERGRLPEKLEDVRFENG